MSSQTSVNISSGEANRSGSDIQGPPQDRNQPEMDTIEDLRKKLQALEKKNLDLTKQHNQDMSHYEKEIMKLRLELERGEALRRVMASEVSFARKDVQVQMYSAEDELCEAKAKLLELQEPLPVRFLPEAAYSRPLPAPASPPDDSVPSFFIPRGVRTPVAPAPDANWRELSDQVFTSGAESEFDPSYSRHFGPLRPATNETTDLMHYRKSDTDLYDVLWITHEPSLLNIPLPSGRSGKTYSLQRPTTTTYVQVCPSGIETISWLDDSSRIRPLSTFTMSTPSWERIRAPVGAPVHPPAPVNASFRGRQRRARSLPPFKSISQDKSSNPRSTQDI
ncbi:uncharacterized protein LOC130264932 [Oenanthe melanoleuca]|uniref:uncharacterized protein LOC130264932 n=1 Tax=Oenanthe melanoleuca TaxID=2939378 RepID=UPI0024C171A3|nr:uncharacterized protein LOC130264932 [Oenanthe melanoleuca]